MEEQKNCRDSDVKTAVVKTPVAPVVETPSAGESDVKKPALVSAASKLANTGKFAKKWKKDTGLIQDRSGKLYLPNGQEGTYTRYFNPSPRTKEFDDMTATELYGEKDTNGLYSKSYTGPNKPGVYAVISPGLNIMEINNNNQWEMQTGDHKGQIYDGEKWVESEKSMALKRDERKKTERGKLTRKRKKRGSKQYRDRHTRRNQEKQKDELKRRRAREERLASQKLVNTKLGGKRKKRKTRKSLFKKKRTKKRRGYRGKSPKKKRTKKRRRRKSSKRGGFGAVVAALRGKHRQKKGMSPAEQQRLYNLKFDYQNPMVTNVKKAKRGNLDRIQQEYKLKSQKTRKLNI